MNSPNYEETAGTMLIDVDGARPAERLDWLSAGHDAAAPRSAVRKTARLSILDRYLLREMGPPFGFALAAFTLFLIINSFFVAADYIINKGVPFALVLRYIVLQLPAFMYLILPFAAMFSVLLGFARLAGDNEVTALRTSGVSLSRIALPCYAAGALLCVAAFGINESLAPRAYHKALESFRQIAYHATQPVIPADQFVKPDWQHVIYIGSIDSATGVMHNVQIFTLRPGYYPDTFSAASGQQVGGKIVLYDGVLTHYEKNAKDVTQQHFRTAEFTLGDTSLLYQGAASAFEMNSAQLRRELATLRGNGQDTRDDQIKLQEKYAMPVACLVGIFIALPLAVRFGKRGRGVAAMLAVVVLFVYYLIMAAAAALGKNGALPVIAAAWVPNAVMLAVGVALLMKEEQVSLRRLVRF
jgi:LPS export ABC transporter permease LptF